jgi:hypothetical protein
MSDAFEATAGPTASVDAPPEAPPSGTTGVGSSAAAAGSRFRRLRSAFPALVAAVTVAVAAVLAAVLSPRWGATLLLVGLLAATLAGIGVLRGRTWPGAVAVGALGAVYCLAVASHEVDVVATSVVAIGLFFAFQTAGGPGGVAGRSGASLALVAAAAAAGPVVLVLARGVSHVPPHLYLPALAAGVAAVVAPVLIATRTERDADADGLDLPQAGGDRSF